MARTVQEVAQAHLEAVESGDVVAMAADYGPDAILIRGTDTFMGHAEIAGYFATVPERLGAARVVFDALRVQGDTAEFDWRLVGTPTPTSGTDTCRIVDGAIVHQVVQLRTDDF